MLASTPTAASTIMRLNMKSPRNQGRYRQALPCRRGTTRAGLGLFRCRDGIRRMSLVSRLTSDAAAGEWENHLGREREAGAAVLRNVGTPTTQWIRGVIASSS